MDRLHTVWPRCWEVALEGLWNQLCNVGAPGKEQGGLAGRKVVEVAEVGGKGAGSTNDALTVVADNKRTVEALHDA